MNGQQLCRIFPVKKRDEPQPFAFPGLYLTLSRLSERVGIAAVRLEKRHLPGGSTAQNLNRRPG